MGRLCHHRYSKKEYTCTTCTTLSCPNWGLRTTDWSRDQGYCTKKSSWYFLQIADLMNGQTTEGFDKNLVVRVHKQSEKEQWYDHIPRRKFLIQHHLLPCTHSAPAVVYKELYFPSYPLVILQWEYTYTEGKMCLLQTLFLSSHSHFTLFSSEERGYVN